MESSARSDDQERSSRGYIDPEFFKKKNRPYRSPPPFRSYPEYDLEDIKKLLPSVAVLLWRPQYQHVINVHRKLRRINTWGPAFLWVNIVTLGALFEYPKAARDAFNNSGIDFHGFSPIQISIVAASLLSVTLWVRLRFNPRFRFFRLLRQAEIMANAWSMYDPRARAVSSVNFAGAAARSLFRYIQKSRRTWGAPPAVADHALECSYPLIDIDLSRRQFAIPELSTIQYYARFLRDASYLVMIEKEEYIPDLRRLYSELPGRERGVSGEIPERDAHFLDPMRAHNRWSVMKDYYYPLASWLSLLVALAALAVSVFRR